MQARETCRTARNRIEDMLFKDGSRSFFPLDRLRSYFKHAKVQEILHCSCAQCQEDLRLFGNQTDPGVFAKSIVGGADNPNKLMRTYFIIFGLLVYLEHPVFILGFLERNWNDYILESWVYRNILDRDSLKLCTGDYQRDEARFERFARRFYSNLVKFAIPHIDSARFVEYDAKTVLPFIEEREIGQGIDDDGHLTSELDNARVFTFKIYHEYCKLPGVSHHMKLVRKEIATPEPQTFLEGANMDYVQKFEDQHIVKLLKAYKCGVTVNFIFPKALTNLGHLLRDPKFSYDSHRGPRFELANAWKQLLGIAKALKKIHDAGEGVDEQFWVRFDLKPDNILVEKVDGLWMITGFEQAMLIPQRRGYTPRIGDHSGTDAYAAPEIEDTSMEFGRAYDIWSLGCIILEVTTFMVLGYAGLKGSSEFDGLDLARQAMPPWARSGDERFFYREAPQGEYVVKREIRNIMDSLERRHARSLDSSEESKRLLGKVLDLIKRMLKPNAKDRVDISRVVATLSRALRHDIRTHQLIPEPDETVLGGPQLNQINLWHWSATNREWEDSHLEAFENETRFMRLHCWAHGKVPEDIYFRRNDVKIVPRYAFWDSNNMWDSRAWIELLFLSTAQASPVSNARYSFDEEAGYGDACVLQSKLTSQNIAGTFALSQVRISRPVPTTTKLIKGFFGKTKAPTSVWELDPLEFGSATIQIWVEQYDAVLEKSQRLRAYEFQASAIRTVRVVDQAQKTIPPCRMVIYLHQQKFICTIRLDRNWVLDENVAKSRILSIKPLSHGGRKQGFFASWIRPTQEEIDDGYAAGIPLNPKILQYFEDIDSFEVEEVQLSFQRAKDREIFKRKFLEVKKHWDIASRNFFRRPMVNQSPGTVPQLPADIGVPPVPQKWAQFQEYTLIGRTSADKRGDYESTREEIPHRQTPEGVKPFHLTEYGTGIRDEEKPERGLETLPLRIPPSHLERDYPPFSLSDEPQAKDFDPEMETPRTTGGLRKDFWFYDIPDPPNSEESIPIETPRDIRKSQEETKVDVKRALGLKFDVDTTERVKNDKATQTEAFIRSKEGGEDVQKAIINTLATNPVLTGMFRYSPPLLQQNQLERRFQHLLKKFYADLMNGEGHVITKRLCTSLRSRENRKTIAREVIRFQRLPDVLSKEWRSQYADPESDDDDEWDKEDAVRFSNVVGFAKLDRVLQALVEGEPFRNLLSGLGKVFLPPRLLEEILAIPRTNIEYSSRERSIPRAILSTVQAFFENVTQLEWDWWPLPPRMPALQDGQSRVYWRCFCGTARWHELRSAQREILEILLQQLPEDSAPTPLCALFKSTNPAFRSTANPSSGPVSGSGSSASARYIPSGRSSSANDSQGIQMGAYNYASPNLLPATGGQAQGQSGFVPAKRLWVNFGVEGPRITPEFDQIEDHGLLTDPIFLRELRRKHHELRGWFRSHLSFWQLSYWDFVKFERIPLKPATRIIVKGVDLPTDSDYEYNPRPPDATTESPPILRHEFEVIVRLCLAPCWFAWLSMLHECHTYEDTRNVILRLPKLNKALGPDPKPIWGIQAKYAVSAVRVVIIHVLILCVSFGLWGWWQWKHPEDLQGAAVPLTVAGVLMSTFWSSTGVLSALR